MNGTTFDMELRGLRVTVVVTHYLPATPDTHDGPGDPEEFEWHLESLNGHCLTVLMGKLTREDEQAVFDRYVKEMES